MPPSPRKHEDLFFLDGHYEDAVPNDNEGEEAGAADIRVVEDVDIQEVEVEEEPEATSEAEEDYDEFWEADELVDAYCLNYGHDDVVDKSAEVGWALVDLTVGVIRELILIFMQVNM